MSSKLFKKRPWIPAVLIGAGIVILSVGLLSFGPDPNPWQFEEGDIATANIYALADFSYINEEETRLKKEEARQSTLPFHVYRTKELETVMDRLHLFWNQLDLLEEERLGGEVEGLILPSQRRILKDSEERPSLKEESLKLAAKALHEPILDQIILDEMRSEGRTAIQVAGLLADKETEVELDAVLGSGAVKDWAETELEQAFPRNRRVRGALADLVAALIPTTLIWDENQTALRQKQAEDEASPAFSFMKQNELIVARGQRINREHLLQLEGLSRKRAQLRRPVSTVGTAMTMGLLVFLLGYLLFKFHPDIFFSPRFLILVGLSVLSLLCVTQALLVWPFLVTYLVPLSFWAMLLTILLNAPVAMSVTLFLGIVLGLWSKGTVGYVWVAYLGAFIGILSSLKVRRRVHILRAGIWIGCVHSIALIGLNFLEARTVGPDWIPVIGAGILSGVAAAALVTLLLPLFENLFGVTTDIRLIELSDLNHPLLKRMVVEAPGTYHHSLMVSNLAESACEAIGANALLARVGCYFHDIGKIEKAEYFIENQTMKKNRHDELPPSMSRMIIMNHVIQGIELAKKHKLPRQIIDFIPGHHGTSLIRYFYQRALEQSSGEEGSLESAYRYHGPRPMVRETAVSMLADSVEATSRTIQEPTPQNLRELVEKIIHARYMDHQLDESGLSIRDLKMIADSFMRTLIGVYHSRIEYPKELADAKEAGFSSHDRLSQEALSRFSSGSEVRHPTGA
jgi:cyclic-di-AMP phosphodiesterase PgpH